MEINRLVELIEKYSPAHFRDICVVLNSLSDELEYTKASLSNELMNAQKHDDFSQARKIIDVQEELSQKITLIQTLLSDMEKEDVIKGLGKIEYVTSYFQIDSYLWLF